MPAKLVIPDLASLIASYVAGEPLKRIQERTGISQPALRHHFLEAGVRLRSHSEARTPQVKLRQSAAKKATAMAAARTHIHEGYRFVYAETGYRREHRVVMERKLGRPLLESEIVHHIDGDRLNNDPSNLELTNQQDHSRSHRQSDSETTKRKRAAAGWGVSRKR